MANIVAVRIDKNKVSADILATVLAMNSTVDFPFGFCISEYRDVKNLVNHEVFMGCWDFDDLGPTNNPYYQIWMERTCVAIN